MSEHAAEKGAPRATIAEALAAWEAKGPTSLTAALLADALYGVSERVHPNRDGETDVRLWQPSDGDRRCQECGWPNVVWYTSHDLWNRVMPDEGILCIPCFIAQAERSIGFSGWFLTVDSAPVSSDFARGFEAGRASRDGVA